MASSLTSAINEITSMTDSLLALAKEKKWQEFETLESQRQILIKKNLHNKLTQPELQEVRDDIRKIQLLDDQIMTLAKHSQASISENLIAFQRSQKASSQYKESSNSFKDREHPAGS